MKTLGFVRAEGYLAGEHNAPESHCPYESGTVQRTVWLEGYAEAMFDYSDEQYIEEPISPLAWLAMASVLTVLVLFVIIILKVLL